MYDNLLQELLQKQRYVDMYGNLPTDSVGIAREESINTARNNKRKKAKLVVEVKPLNCIYPFVINFSS